MNYKMLSEHKLLISVNSPEESKDLGILIGELSYPGLTVLFFGGLGAGKTVIAQGIGSALGIKNIKSPTFIIVSEYVSDTLLAHADLYRLEKEYEVDLLDLESYVDYGYVLLVEWAERWNFSPTKDTFKITIEKTELNENSREITVEAIGDKAEETLAQLSSHLSVKGK